jgi:2',3'-cyclic-nucleotide 2'-phosphodiesterase (5'-nucleotidase family)
VPTPIIARAIRQALRLGAIAVLAAAPVASSQAAFTLQLLHASDLEGGLDAIERAKHFAAITEYLDENSGADGSVILSAGDNYIPGPFFGAAGDSSVQDELRAVHNAIFGVSAPASLDIRAGDGRADITIMNAIGFDASALGNHEFDAGTGVVRELIRADVRGTTLGTIRWLGANFPYLSANLDFSADPNLSDLFTPDVLVNTAFQADPANLTGAGTKKRLARATVIEVNGQKVGVVGATTPLLQSISSPGNTTVRNPGAGTNDMAALAGILQPVIDQVIAQGVNKVITVTHLQQLALEKQLAGLLTGVDVMIAGGSDSILNNGRPLRPGDTAVDTYPVQMTGADGKPVLIVSTDGEYSYVGRLVVTFDDAGVVTAVSPDSGPYVTEPATVEALWGSTGSGAGQPFEVGSRGALTQQVTEAVQGVVNAKDGNVYGLSSVYLDGRRERVRTEETNLGNLTADANLAAAQALDPSVRVSIKNGGGIRAPIGLLVETPPGSGTYVPQPNAANTALGKPEGGVSQLDVENSLRFNNRLSLLTLTADGLRQILEHGVRATAPGATPGQFPQVGGVRFSFDPGRPAGERVRSAMIMGSDGRSEDRVVQNGRVVGDPNRAIRVVTLNFMANPSAPGSATGGDGYPFPALATAKVDTAIGEQQALADYLVARHPVGGLPFDRPETERPGDTRIQNLAARGDTVTLDQDGDGDVDQHDVEAVLKARTRSAAGGHPQDVNGDGKVDVVDARLTALRCTRPRCATN